jgi:hypothetical protein
MKYFDTNICEDSELIENFVDEIINQTIENIITDNIHYTYQLMDIGKQYQMEVEITYRTHDRLFLQFNLFKSLFKDVMIMEKVGSYERFLYPIKEMRKYKIRILKII